MSKIKVDEIQADFKRLRLNGTVGKNVQIQAPLDQPTEPAANAALQLTTRTGDNIKFIAPDYDKQYTLILPKHQVQIGDLIKVESVVNNDDGQLAFAPPGISTQTNLNADNLTSGTLSADRFPTNPPEAGFSFIEKKTIGSKPEPFIFLDKFDDNSLYLVIAKTMVFVDDTNFNDARTYPKIQLLDANGRQQNHITFVDNFGPQDQGDHEADTNELTLQAHADTEPGERSMAFTSLISTKAGETYVQTRGMQPGFNRKKHEGYAAFNSSGSTQRIHGIRIVPNLENTLIKDCQLLLYKYLKL